MSSHDDHWNMSINTCILHQYIQTFRTSPAYRASKPSQINFMNKGRIYISRVVNIFGGGSGRHDIRVVYGPPRPKLAGAKPICRVTTDDRAPSPTAAYSRT